MFLIDAKNLIDFKFHFFVIPKFFVQFCYVYIFFVFYL